MGRPTTTDDDMMDQPKPHQSLQRKPESGGPKGGIPGAANEMPRHQNVNITDMIRSLQRTEGLSDCFRRGLADCDQRECAWRQYCLEKAEGLQPPKRT